MICGGVFVLTKESGATPPPTRLRTVLLTKTAAAGFFKIDNADLETFEIGRTHLLLTGYQF